MFDSFSFVIIITIKQADCSQNIVFEYISGRSVLLLYDGTAGYESFYELARI